MLFGSYICSQTLDVLYGFICIYIYICGGCEVRPAASTSPPRPSINENVCCLYKVLNTVGNFDPTWGGTQYEPHSMILQLWDSQSDPSHKSLTIRSFTYEPRNEIHHMWGYPSTSPPPINENVCCLYKALLYCGQFWPNVRGGRITQYEPHNKIFHIWASQ